MLIDKIPNLIRSGYTLLAAKTDEASRFIEDLNAVCKDKVFMVDLTMSHTPKVSAGYGSDDNPSPLEGVLKLISSIPLSDKSPVKNYHIKFLEGLMEKEIPEDISQIKILFVLQDMDTITAREPTTVSRMLLDFLGMFKGLPWAVLILGGVVQIPKNISSEVTIVKSRLPDRTAREELIVKSLRSATVAASEEVVQAAVSNSSGMTHNQLYDSIYYAVRENVDLNTFSKVKNKNHLTMHFANSVFELKRTAVEAHHVFKFMPPDTDFSAVGGHGEFKEWVTTQMRLLSPEARRFNLPNPKGVILFGFPGTGKSLFAKCMSRQFEMPLFAFNPSRLMTSLIGESEAFAEQAFDIIASMDRCVIFIDEIEKIFSKEALEGHNSSPVMQRVFGMFLTLLSDRTSGAYIVATANSINMPDALLRRGRWDDKFFMDLPNRAERRDIFAIHLKRYFDEQDIQMLDAYSSMLVDGTQGFSGAEIEDLVNSSASIQFRLGKIKNDKFDVKSFFETMMLQVSSFVPDYQSKKREYDLFKETVGQYARKTCKVDPADAAPPSGSARFFDN